MDKASNLEVRALPPSQISDFYSPVKLLVAQDLVLS